MKRLLPALFLLLCIGSAAARVMIPPELRPPTQYLEIVREKKAPCTSDCFVEYILLSNGVVVKKQLHTDKYDNAIPAFSLRRMDMAAAGAVLDKAGAFLATAQPESGNYIDPNNLYYYDGEKHHVWSSIEAADEFSAIVDAARDAFDGAKMAEEFYLHQYYQPLDGGTQALHIFADGTIISSVFERLSYSMTGTEIARLADKDLAKTKTLAADAQNATAEKFTKCTAGTGLEYGVVEFTQGGNTLKSYTCATGSDPVSALFGHVKALGGN